MRKVNKPEQVPEKLIEVQNEIADKLYLRKESFKWDNSHYNAPIKDTLVALYHNKCAFCEVKLLEWSAETKFTVEHFRPKAYYYWLGAEWTNLFPACQACNSKKEDKFPLNKPMFKVKLNEVPFDEFNKLKIDYCNASHESLLREEPLFIHPEIDNPEDYFYFEPSGKAVANPELDAYQARQASEMISYFLNRPSLEVKRKKMIKDFRDRLDTLIERAFKMGGVFTQRELYLLFLDFFCTLNNQKKEESEFSLLGRNMVMRFDEFFLVHINTVYGENAKSFVESAYKQFYKLNPDS